MFCNVSLLAVLLFIFRQFVPESDKMWRKCLIVTVTALS